MIFNHLISHASQCLIHSSKTKFILVWNCPTDFFLKSPRLAIQVYLNWKSISKFQWLEKNKQSTKFDAGCMFPNYSLHYDGTPLAGRITNNLIIYKKLCTLDMQLCLIFRADNSNVLPTQGTAHKTQLLSQTNLHMDCQKLWFCHRSPHLGKVET